MTDDARQDELQKLRYDNEELREASDRLYARIEDLEADVVKWEEYANDLLDAKNKRIEALEAALRILIDNVRTGSYESTLQAIAAVEASFAPEQD